MIIDKINLKPQFNTNAMLLKQSSFTQEQLCIYDGLRIKVSPGVFHPGYCPSAGIMHSFINKTDLSCKRFLELGSGSGIISIAAAKKNAAVTALDINPEAVRNTVQNAILNGVVIKARQSDMFEKLPFGYFDMVVVNPPISLEDASDVDSGDFFQRFFNGVKKFIGNSGKIFMVLSQRSPQELIIKVASEAGFNAAKVYAENESGGNDAIWQFNKKNQF